MEWLGRYSMTDVMVLALMIFYVNSSGYTEARVLPGVYFFAASALMTMLAYGWANAEPSARRRSGARRCERRRPRDLHRPFAEAPHGNGRRRSFTLFEMQKGRLNGGLPMKKRRLRPKGRKRNQRE